MTSLLTSPPLTRRVAPPTVYHQTKTSRSHAYTVIPSTSPMQLAHAPFPQYPITTRIPQQPLPTSISVVGDPAGTAGKVAAG